MIMFSWYIDSWELQCCRIDIIISKMYLFSIVSFMEVVVVDIRLHHGHLWVLFSELAISVSSSGNHLISFTLSPPHTHTAAHDLTPALTYSWLACQELAKWLPLWLTVLSPCVILQCVHCSVIFGHCSTICEILLSTCITPWYHYNIMAVMVSVVHLRFMWL